MVSKEDCKQLHNDPQENLKQSKRDNSEDREDLIVGSTTDDFFACRSQENGVLELGRVAALCIAEGRIRIYDAFVAEVLERHQVFSLVQPIKPAATKGQCSKVLVDDVQKLLWLD